MAEKKEWVKEYHTPTVGTKYHITLAGNNITLEAIDKPYKLSISKKDLEKLLNHTTGGLQHL